MNRTQNIIDDYNTKIVPHIIEQREKKAVFPLKLNGYKTKRNNVALLAHYQRGFSPPSVASTVFYHDLMLKMPATSKE